MTVGELIVNGRCTGLHSLVISSVIANPASYFWTSQEGSRTNAWGVYFSSGYVFYGGKFYSVAVRAVAALTDQDKEDWLAAYEDCCRHKYTSLQCTLYRLQMEDDLFVIAAEVVILHSYRPSTSTAFGVRYPTLREIFAAAFRDRIVQHWIVMRINPIFEARFIAMGNVSYNCRENFGTLAAVLRVQAEIDTITAGYTTRAVIGLVDIASFFMTIDRQVAWELLQEFILENQGEILKLYPNTDINILLKVTEITLKHNPQLDCRRCGDLSFWLELAPNKSLFNAPPGVGLPIGNITSQLVANFVLSFLDEFLLRECKKLGATFIRFVDDIVIIARTEADAVYLRGRAKWFLETKLHQTIHPRKFYLQTVNKGARFVGHYIKPGRIYTSNRTIGRFYDTAIEMENVCRAIVLDGPDVRKAFILESLVSGANSHFGFLVHTASFNIRQKLLTLFQFFWQVCYIENLHVVKIKKAYRASSIYIKEEYEDNIRLNASEAGGFQEPFITGDPYYKFQPGRNLRRPDRVRKRYNPSRPVELLGPGRRHRH